MTTTTVNFTHGSISSDSTGFTGSFQTDDIGSGSGGATIPSTTNLIKGNGSGNGADSGVAVSSLLLNSAIGTTVQGYSAALAAVTGTNTGDQLVFKNIAVSGQSDVVADSAADTLTLVAGSGMTITTNASTDTITFASSGGGSYTNPAFVNVKDYGAMGDGTTDDTAAINSAIAAVSSTGGGYLSGIAGGTGGGVVFFPKGVYLVSDTVYVGNGSSSAEATAGHNVTLLGVAGCSVIKYNGTTDSAKAVIYMKGPAQNIHVDNMYVDCNAKAGYGYIVDNIYHGGLQNPIAWNYTAGLMLFTAYGDLPSGVGYGCSENLVIAPKGYPSGANANGIVFASRATAAAKADSCRNHIIGGTFYYSGDNNTAGFVFAYADNNTVDYTLALPVTLAGNGSVARFDNQSGTPFPSENELRSISGHQVFAKGSMSYKNYLYFPHTNDGSTIPTITNFVVVQAEAGINVPAFGAVGAPLFAQTSSGVTSGATCAGSNLTPAYITESGAVVASGSHPSGTWRNMGATTASNGCTTFMRTV